MEPRFNHMFLHNKVFNQDIGDWDVSNARSFSSMFEMLDPFNQDIGDWDVSILIT